jgi:hypothetical protein
MNREASRKQTPIHCEQMLAIVSIPRLGKIGLAFTVLCVFYLLSFGPVCRLAIRSGCSAAQLVTLDKFYAPVILAAQSPLKPLVSLYASIWGLEIANSGNYSTPEPGEEIVWFIRPPL